MLHSEILHIRQIFRAGKLYLLRRCSTQNVFNMSDPAVQVYLKNLMFEHEHLYTKMERTPEESTRYFEIKPIVNLLQHRLALYDNIVSLKDLHKRHSDEDDDIKKMIKEEAQIYLKRMTEIDRELQSILLEPQLTEGSVLLEVTAGTGGQEAMLFARELFEMYELYAKYKDWEACIVSYEKSDTGGIKKASMFVQGVGVSELMTLEAGVHRVQRIPATEKSGRIHTSTVSVTVLPNPINIPDSDIVIETKRASDAGSQHVNNMCPTGIAVECQEDRSQMKNKEIAIQKLRTLLLEKQQQEPTSKINCETKSMIDSKNRIEKIRTYNFPQDQVIEHREGGGTFHNLQSFMEGDYKLEQLQQNLLREHKRHLFLEEISRLANTINEKSTENNK